MGWFTERRFPVWAAFLLGFCLALIAVMLMDRDAPDFGNALGFAFIPAIAAGALAAFLAYRHNGGLRR